MDQVRPQHRQNQGWEQAQWGLLEVTPTTQPPVWLKIKSMVGWARLGWVAAPIGSQ